ncbi:MAG: lysophospholipid acyltransferase family protein [Candidatus Omnitrophota bacterium]
MLYWFGKIFGGIFSWIFFRLKVDGVDNIPRRGAVILAANHISWLDPPLVAMKVPRRITFISKTTFHNNFFTRPIIRSVGIIPLRQHSGAVGMIGAIKSLKKGRAMVIFPEGTRNLSGKPFLPASPGVAFLAEGTGAPVVPVYLEGTDKALPNRARIFRPREIRVFYGKLLTFPGGSRQEFADKVMAAIAELKDRRQTLNSKCQPSDQQILNFKSLKSES